MPSNVFPSTSMRLGTLREATDPSLLDLRNLAAGLQGRDSWILQQAFEQINAAFDNVQQTLRSASPQLEYLQVSAADIESLYVGGEYGPGEFGVFSGPPSYANVGWIGSAASATPVSILSITAGVATTATDHGLKANAALLVEGAGANSGYFVVDAIVSPTEFTVVGGFPANTSGGTVTRLFAGGWLGQFACGGTSFEDAPLRVDVDGLLSIQDALISLIDGSKSIVLDPSGPTITSVDALGDFVQISGSQITFATPGGNPQLVESFNGFIQWNTAGKIVAQLNDGPTGAGGGTFTLRDAAGVVVVKLEPGASSSIDSGTKDINAGGVYRVGGNQVVSARKSKPTQTTRTAGAAYGANEQVMLNELKAWQDGVNAALSALAGGHGLWA